VRETCVWTNTYVLEDDLVRSVGEEIGARKEHLPISRTKLVVVDRELPVPQHLGRAEALVDQLLEFVRSRRRITQFQRRSDRRFLGDGCRRRDAQQDELS